MERGTASSSSSWSGVLIVSFSSTAGMYKYRLVILPGAEDEMGMVPHLSRLDRTRDGAGTSMDAERV